MIEIRNLNKYFNKGSANQIHVINNTTLSFPMTGLVSITGPSGCGKTTLLNVIGGLDSFESGEIEFDGKTLKKYKALELDVLRNSIIGYIFQNYSLIEDKTVYENIEISLNMAGLYDEKEIDDRINYVLEAVGMRNYRKRSVLALSGGQRQRVGIARALAKNPKVILADEPTGNLDANNTFEVMEIIKKISQNCLVILVSHEKQLVDFYSDRVIQISDGSVVKDYENSGNRTIDRSDERNIYLKDLQSNHQENHGVARYYENELDDSLSLTVVEIKDSIYIKANTNSKKKIKYLSSDTEINLINAHYEERKSEDALKHSFDMHKYGEIQRNPNKKSFIRLKDSFAQGFKKSTRKRKFGGKLFLVAQFIISCILVVMLATLGNLNQVNEEDFLNVSKELISLNFDTEYTQDDVRNIYENVDHLELSPYSRKVGMTITYYRYYQGVSSGQTYVGFSGYPVKSSWVDETQMKYGRMPENSNEIVLDMWVANKALENAYFREMGVKDVQDLIGSIVTCDSSGLYFEIVGIIESESPVMVVEDEAIYSFLSLDKDYGAYGNYADRITIESGRPIQNENEVLIKTDNELYEIGDTYSLGGNHYLVVGEFRYNDENFDDEHSDYLFAGSIIEDKLLRGIMSSYNFMITENVYFYSDDKEAAIADINEYDEDAKAFDSYTALLNQQLEDNSNSTEQRARSLLIVLVGIIIYIYFMMRSSMLKRIKEIGTYRAIGATKRDVYKMFLGEIFWNTTVSTLPGFIVMTYLINITQNSVNELLGGISVTFFYFPAHYFIISLLGLYVINFVFGLLPIFNLLRKTPSQINAKFDI